LRVYSVRHALAAAVIGAAAVLPAAAETRIAFASVPPADFRVGEAKGAPILGYLTRPGGKGPFPAVVLLHSCLGLPPDRREIGDRLATAGYAALFVDDFSTRGLAQTCDVDFAPGVADALGALRAVALLPYVDPRKIAVVGFSQGAGTALELASSRLAETFADPKTPRFAAAAGFYPPCANLDGETLEIPTLIVVGALDDVTPATDCQRLASRGARTRLITLPGARHAFDDPDFAGGRRVHGMFLKYDRAAAAKATAELDAFLRERLGR
jgi:dienelactone hydrolase